MVREDGASFSFDELVEAVSTEVVARLELRRRRRRQLRHKRYLTVRQAAEYLDSDRPTIHLFLAAGRLTALRPPPAGVVVIDKRELAALRARLDAIEAADLDLDRQERTRQEDDRSAGGGAPAGGD